MSCSRRSIVPGLATSLALLLLVLSVNTVHAQETTQVPRRQQPVAALAQGTELPPPLAGRPRRHSALLIAGVSTLLSGYLTSVAAGLFVSGVFEDDCNHDGDRICAHARMFLIPLVGPLLPPGGQEEMLNDPASRLVLAGPQLVGAVLTLAGVFMNWSPPTSPRRTEPGLNFSALPLKDGAGLAAYGTF